jgi:hypothetical protein
MERLFGPAGSSRQLQPVASHRGDGGDKASQCNEQPGDLDEQPLDLRGKTSQEDHSPDQGGDPGLGLRLGHARHHGASLSRYS